MHICNSSRYGEQAKKEGYELEEKPDGGHWVGVESEEGGHWGRSQRKEGKEAESEEGTEVEGFHPFVC